MHHLQLRAKEHGKFWYCDSLRGLNLEEFDIVESIGVGGFTGWCAI